jgi:hypothetical protein
VFSSIYSLSLPDNHLVLTQPSIHSFLSFEKLNGRPTGKLKVASEDLKELVERIGISKAFVQRMLEPQIWDGNHCSVITGENDSPKKFCKSLIVSYALLF